MIQSQQRFWNQLSTERVSRLPWDVPSGVTRHASIEGGIRVKIGKKECRMSLTVVPSMGSTTNVGAAVRFWPGAYVSSPMKSKSGYRALSRDDTSASTALSVSVTMSAAGPPPPTASARHR